jgi:phosphoglycolate phosphatase-like HAD superfamily hydrolase
MADFVSPDVSLPEIADAESGYRNHGCRWVKHLEIGLDQPCLDDLDRAYALHESRLAESGAGSLFPGMEAFLRGCIKEDVSLALGVDAKRHYLMAILERYQLDSLFQVTVCTEEFGMGDADEMMLEIMCQVEVHPSETLMLGTRPRTFQAARAADIVTIGCGWGIQNLDAIAEADLQCRIIPELNAIIRKADTLAIQKQEQ